MNIVGMNKLWSEVHSLHFDVDDHYASLPGTGWVESMRDTPNGSLLKDNSFFKSLRSEDNKLYILHVTRDMKKINKSSILYPSAGCLVGCIYGTQLYKQLDGRFLMHNLGKHILIKEAVLSGKKPTPLIIEVTFNNSSNYPLLSGINYLKLGKIHYAIYENLKYLLSPLERDDLEGRVVCKIKKSLNFISLCYPNHKSQQCIDGREFIKLVNKTVPNLAILGYIYFEAIAEYTMLFSNDKNSQKMKDCGEFNNTIYKEFLLDVYEKIGRFKLSDFNPSMVEIEKKINTMNNDGRAEINVDDFFDYMSRRISNMVVDLLLSDSTKEPKWLNATWDYRGLSSVLGPLVGHTVHRELRNFNRYNDFYFYFDQFKALSAWNYWNKMNIALPFNGPLQKGEIGINPAYQNASYKIYVAKIDKKSDDFLIIHKERTDIEIVPRLVDLRHTAMRSRDHETSEERRNDRSRA